MHAFSPTWLFQIRDSAKELLPREDLRCLRSFLAAFEVRLVKLGLVSQGECSPPQEFSEWIGRRFSIAAELSAFSLVQLKYGKEHTAFHQFFLLLEEFWRKQPAKIAERPSQRPTEFSSLKVDRTEWFQKIYERPTLYLGEKSLTALYALIQGDRYAISVAGVRALEIPSLKEIEARITQELGYPQDCDVRQILLLHSGFDEKTAFEKFYEFLDMKSGLTPDRAD